MRCVWLCFGGFWSVFGGAFAAAQMHVTKKPETVVRAVAVYEYTGEEGKATASRVVPVSLFINGELQDAGVYLARPVPFAINTGNVYEVQKSGRIAGTLDVAYERQLKTTTPQAEDVPELDDPWQAFGSFLPRKEPVLVAKKQSGPLPKLQVSGGKSDSGPKLVTRNEDPKPADSKTDDADERRSSGPTLHRAPGSGSDDSDTTKKTSTADKTGTDKTDSSDSDTADAERPTLKRRSPAEIKANQKKKDSAKVVAGNDLNDDPDRPTLHRGGPAAKTVEQEIPPLNGLPKEMRQMVAVSDAKDRDEHDFTRAWDSDAERADVLSKMQGFARAKLAEYKGVPAPAPATPVVTKPAGPTHSAAAAAAAARRKKAAAAAAAPVQAQLTDEVLKGYTLSYGGAATYVYQASSPAVGGATRYVTVVAQEDSVTGLKLALANVTDSEHLDRTPWMRLVDVVDAEASNRASLLMELRAQHMRQFALYRVIGAKAEQAFVSGTTE